MSDRPVVIYATSTFLRKFSKLVDEEGRLALYRHLEKNPRDGQLIPGSGGIRKLRWARPGMGKRGGVRVIYYFFDARGLLSLVAAYAKSEREDLSKQEIKAFAAVAEQIRNELEDDDASE